LSAPAERLYLDGADPDVAARHVARYEKAVALADRADAICLDYACGSGYGSQIIARTAHLVIGYDSDMAAIRYAIDQHDAANVVYTGIRSHNWWWAFDVIVSIETLEHLPSSEQSGLIADFARWLRPDGVLVLACPLGNGPSTSNPYHLHEPTREELAAMLDACFASVFLTSERYESTSGPAVQAWAVCKLPR
jgi:2-polyprenyl-3-methyl-5-hydroxy-6-metoxy-1,4-benzoquinol methylase